MARSPRQAVAGKPPAKRPAKPAPRRVDPNSINPPVPPSVAATPASFYSPEHAEAILGQPVTSSMDALQRASAFHADTAAHAIGVEDAMSADEAVAGQVFHEEIGEEETLEQAIARVRQLGRPLGLFTQKLALPKKAGYHTHWFNDEGSRLVDAMSAGWTHRKDEDGRPFRRAVGRGRDSGVLYAFALNIPEVIWQEEMSARHLQAGAKMESLKRSPAMAPSGTAQRSDAGKFYSPVEGQDPIQIVKA